MPTSAITPAISKSRESAAPSIVAYATTKANAPINTSTASVMYLCQFKDHAKPLFFIGSPRRGYGLNVGDGCRRGNQRRADLSVGHMPTGQSENRQDQDVGERNNHEWNTWQTPSLDDLAQGALEPPNQLARIGCGMSDLTEPVASLYYGATDPAKQKQYDAQRKADEAGRRNDGPMHRCVASG